MRAVLVRPLAGAGTATDVARPLSGTRASSYLCAAWAGLAPRADRDGHGVRRAGTRPAAWERARIHGRHRPAREAGPSHLRVLYGGPYDAAARYVRGHR